MTKKVPKGTSEYQAAWIVGDDEEDDENGDESSEEEIDESDEEMEESDNELKPTEEAQELGEDEQSNLEKMSTMSQNESFGDIGDMEIDMEEVEKYRQERENEQWPDEVETPHDVAARIRFQKYRGLKSFR